MLRLTLTSSKCWFPVSTPKNNVFRLYSRNSGKSGIGSKYDPYIKDKISTGEGAFNFGKGAAAGAAAIGVGALCFYGSGMGGKTSTYNESMFWEKHVKERISATYGYLGGSLVLTAISAVACVRSPTLMMYYSRGGIMTMLGTFALMVGTGMATRAIEYRPGIGMKQLVWALHCGVIGLTIAPICLLGGAIASRAAWYTAGLVGGLSTVAVFAPNDRFLYMGGMLGAGLGVVFVSSLASMFIAPTGAIGAGLASMSLYGGLILFGGFVLYDTQRVVRLAETYPSFAIFDPVEASMSLYMDTINIFIRLAVILAGGGGSRKK